MLPSFLRRRGSLRPAWRYKANGVIWRIVPTRAGRLVGEARNLASKEVSFFCLDASAGTPLWSGASFGEQWWIGIEALSGETLLLHKFATPSLPEHRTIIAVDVASGEQLWMDEDLKLEALADGSIIAGRNTPAGPRYFRVDVRTGAQLDELNEAEAIQLGRNEKSSGDNVLDMKTPTPIFSVAEEASQRALLIRKHCPLGKILEPVEYLEHGDALIFNYHERSKSSSEENIQSNSILKILDKNEGTVLFESVVNTGSSTVVPESFFVRQDTLMYIHEHTTLTAIDLAALKTR